MQLLDLSTPPRLNVDRTFHRTLSRGSNCEESSSLLKYDLVGERVEDEYHIGSEYFEWVNREKFPKSKDPAFLFAYHLRQIETIQPVFVLDWETQATRLDELDSVTECIRDSMKDLVPWLMDVDDATIRWYANLLLDKSLVQMRASQDWECMLFGWNGLQLPLGKRMEFGGIEDRILGRTVSSHYSVIAENGPDAGTVCMTVVQRPNEGHMKTFINALVGGDFVKMMGLPEDAELYFECRYVTVTSPSTLIPVSFEKTRLWKATSPDGEKLVRDEQIWTYRFSIDGTEAVEPINNWYFDLLVTPKIEVATYCDTKGEEFGKMTMTHLGKYSEDRSEFVVETEGTMESQPGSKEILRTVWKRRGDEFVLSAIDPTGGMRGSHMYMKIVDDKNITYRCVNNGWIEKTGVEKVSGDEMVSVADYFAYDGTHVMVVRPGSKSIAKGK